MLWWKGLLIAGAAGLLGCATPKVSVSPNLITLRKVAVLPIANETTDLDGPVYVRKLLQEGLAKRGVELVPLDDVDKVMRENGFTDGGQLKAGSPQKFGEWTGADTLFYPVLEEFSYLNLGFYWQRRVKVSARLMDAKTGENLWEGDREWATRDLVTDQRHAKEQFATQLAAKAFEKLTHAPLQPESRLAVNRLLDALPIRR